MGRARFDDSWCHQRVVQHWRTRIWNGVLQHATQWCHCSEPRCIRGLPVSHSQCYSLDDDTNHPPNQEQPDDSRPLHSGPVLQYRFMDGLRSRSQRSFCVGSQHYCECYKIVVLWSLLAHKKNFVVWFANYCISNLIRSFETCYDSLQSFGLGLIQLTLKILYPSKKERKHSKLSREESKEVQPSSATI